MLEYNSQISYSKQLQKNILKLIDPNDFSILWTLGIWCTSCNKTLVLINERNKDSAVLPHRLFLSTLFSKKEFTLNSVFTQAEMWTCYFILTGSQMRSFCILQTPYSPKIRNRKVVDIFFLFLGSKHYKSSTDTFSKASYPSHNKCTLVCSHLLNAR